MEEDFTSIRDMFETDRLGERVSAIIRKNTNKPRHVSGIIRYYGRTFFETGVWVGIELDAKYSKWGKKNLHY